MKKLLQFIVAVTIIGAAVSCDSISKAISPTKMDTVEGTQLVIDGLKKNVDLNKWKVYELYWMEGEELENNLQMLYVGMINEDNGCFTQTFHLAGPVAGTASNLHEAIGIGMDKLNYNEVKGITPEMIDPEAIRQQYEAAKAMLPEKYDFKSIGTYRFKEVLPTGNSFIDRGKQIGRIDASFELNMTERGKEYVESAGKRSMQYYEVDFNVLPDGSVEIDE